MASPTGFVFWTPANQQDFPDNPSKQANLNTLWNVNLNGFIQQGITGDPWNETYAAGITNYFNPLDTPIPPSIAPQQITWSPFPGRISAYNSQDNWGLSDQQILQLADTGYYGNQQSFPAITTDPCSGNSENLPYGPYGPRGWQDEYCEWSVRRDDKGNIIRVDMTCENPEYWNSLWIIHPKRVVDLYRQALDKPQIQEKDLYLYDSGGNVVIDPSTGRPAYNPLNKWNLGPVSTDAAGGAMHLTSTPNTLQTEIGLASAATVQRQNYSATDPNGLICCAQYGQIYRNSDPHIGASVNAVVAGLVTGQVSSVTLSNPPGLYIQEPANWAAYGTPDDTPASNFWTIKRGVKTLNDSNGNTLPGNFILHAVFEVPPKHKYTVSDITINGQPIQWAGQIIQTMEMQILATPINANLPASVPCVGQPGTVLAQPLQLFQAAVFNAMNQTSVANPVKQPMTLLSNSTLIAPMVAQGAQNVPLVLTAATLGQTYSVTFDDSNISATITGSISVTYAVPGNSYPGEVTAIQLSVSVGSNTPLGLHNVYITNSGQPQAQAMPALLNVVSKIGN